MNSKKTNIIISLFFCAILLAGVVGEALSPDKYYSESEKRTLTQIGQISPKDLFSGKMGTTIESYLSDQFPLRDGWITVKTLTELALGKRESGGVYFCGDGYLIEKQTRYDQKQLERNLTAIKKLSDSLAKSGVNLKIMLIPTASEILSDKLPAFAPNVDQTAIIQAAKAAGLDTVNPTKLLKEHNGEYIYYKTDHHYTSLGAYYCYKAWKESKDETADPLTSWNTETLCDNFRGTTYAKVNYPFAQYDTITAYYKTLKHTVIYNNGSYVTNSIYERNYLQGKDQYAVFFNSNQSDTVAEGSGKGNLLILKDSFANCFAQFVVDEYSQTHMIDMRFYKKSISEYVKDNNINEVLVLYSAVNFASDTGVSYVK